MERLFQRAHAMYRSHTRPSTLVTGASISPIALLPAVALGQSSFPNDPALVSQPADTGEALTQAFFLNLGFSFLVGLAAGYALKIAFKIALLAIGVILIGVFGLQYAGLVDVNWGGVEVQYDTWAQWLQIQGGAFLDFMGRNLSSGASFIAGLAIGLKL
jgi:uncharacterized membrane protein (Fun14 family)